MLCKLALFGALALVHGVAAEEVGMLSTYDGCFGPFCGCGVPPEKLAGLPIVSLNLIDGDRYLDPVYPIPENVTGAYDNGANCGRWIEIELGRVCIGAGHSEWAACDKGDVKDFDALTADNKTGTVIYGYVADSCGAPTYWCREVPGHVYMLNQYTDELNLTSPELVAREIFWTYLNDTPAGWEAQEPKFMWKDGVQWLNDGQGFYGALIIYDVPNGIGMVEQKQGGSWDVLSPLEFLGNQYILNEPFNYRNATAPKEVTVRVTDISGDAYGEYTLSLEACSNEACWTTFDVVPTELAANA